MTNDELRAAARVYLGQIFTGQQTSCHPANVDAAVKIATARADELPADKQEQASST